MLDAFQVRGSRLDKGSRGHLNSETKVGDWEDRSLTYGGGNKRNVWQERTSSGVNTPRRGGAGFRDGDT